MKVVRWDETNSSGVVKSYGFKGLTQNFREDSDPAYEKAFLSILADSICESIHDTLGKDVLSLLVSKGFLDDMANPRELDKQLSSVFGNASLMLERIIVKGLYQKLSIPYDSLGFDYSNALDKHGDSSTSSRRECLFRRLSCASALRGTADTESGEPSRMHVRIPYGQI
jgi:hypothetical protein